MLNSYLKSKKFSSLLIVIVLALFLVLTLIVLQKEQIYKNFAATANPYTGIHVVGNKFENALGQVIHVHGVNVTEMDYGNVFNPNATNDNGGCNTINTQIIDAIATWNVNWVRLWINPPDWLNNVDCGNGVNYQTKVMTIIHQIENDGMIAEPTFVSDTPLDSNGHTAGLSNLGLQFWTSFAPFLTNEPAVALDLINEPIGTEDSANGWKCLFQGMTSGTCNLGAGGNWNGQGQYQYIGYNQVISVIRAAGFTGPIGTPGTNYARGATGFQTYAPTNAGIYLPYHEYEGFSTASNLLTQLAINWNKFPVLLEEFQGSAGDPWLDTVMQGIDNGGQGVGYAVWQWGNDGSNDGLQVVQPDTCPTCYFDTGKDYHDYIATQSSLTGAGITPTVGPSFTPTPTLMPGATSPIYTDSLATNWVDWSWSDVDNFANTSPVFSGTKSIVFSLSAGFAGLYLHSNVGISTQPYSYLHFAAQASQAGQQYQVGLADSANNFLTLVPLSTVGGNPTVGSWKTYNIPLSSLSGTNQTISGVVIQDTTGNAEPNLFVDDISLTNPGTTPTTGPTPTNTPVPTATPTPSGQTSFDDEFNGTSIDTTQWTLLNRQGDLSNSEQECYKPANITESGGFATITDQHLTSSIQCSSQGDTTSTYNYTSGMMQTTNFNFLYGTLEFRAKPPSAGGQWPAIWLLGSNCQASNILSADNTGLCQWPVDAQSSAEIDVMEEFNGLANQVNEQIHNGTTANNDSFVNGCYTNVGFDTSTAFHTYDLIWAPNSLIWKVDGVTECTSTSHVPSHPMFILMNLALGGAGGSISNSAFPQAMQVDYIKVIPPSGSSTPTPTNTPVPTNTPTRTPTPTATTAPTPTRTPTPSPTPVTTKLALTIGLDGIGKAGDNVSRTSTGNTSPLHPQRNVTLILSDQNNNPLPAITGQVSYDSVSGLFTGTVTLPSTVTAGFYTLKVSSPSFLQKAVGGILTLTQGQTTTVPTTDLTAGDINNDNQISLLDYNQILSCFGSSTSTCTPSDLDDDGIVGGSDYNLFLRELSVQIGG